MGVDVIDWTVLAKKGLIKETKVQAAAPDVIDLRPQVQEQPAQIDNVTDFLSGFAQASVSPNEHQVHASPDLSLKLDTITNKLDDVMYKIETLTSRLTQMESRFRNA